METLISWVITCGLVINIIFSFKEGRDERGRKIMFFSASDFIFFVVCRPQHPQYYI